MFLKVLWSSLENTCTGVTFSMRLQAWPTSLLQKRLQHKGETFKTLILKNTCEWGLLDFEYVLCRSLKIHLKTIFDKMSSETGRKELFITKLELFWIYLQCNNWSAIDEIIFVFQEDSNFRELSSEDKLNLEIAPVCYFIRNEKGGCGWTARLQNYYWYMGNEMKSWVYLLSWK